MRRIALFLAGLALALVATTAAANFKCGLKPLPPLGCDSDDAVCVCDDQGNCQWVFVGCG